jgi:amino acid adenylation domain-containing protein
MLVDCDRGSSLPQWLQQLQQNQNQLLQYEFSALSDIQKWSGVNRSLFEALLVFENYPVETGDLPGQSQLRIDRIESTEWTNLPLTLIVSEKTNHDSASLNFTLKYDQTYFHGADMQQYLGYFQFYLMELENHLGSRLGDFPPLIPSQQAQLASWNQTPASYSELPIHEQFERQVQQTPQAIALKFRDRSLTYAELNAQANQLAYYLQQQQLQPEQPVGVCLSRSLELVIALLGISKAGGIYVPIEPDYPQSRQESIIDQTQLRFLITDITEVEFANVTHCIDLNKALSAEIIEANGSNSNLNIPVSPDAPLYILHTSGSTGIPKGVVVSHRSISNRLQWMQDCYSLTTSDRILQKTPFSFDVSVWEFFWPLLQGATLVIAEPGGHRDINYLDRIIQTEEISVLHFVPSMLRAFLDLPKIPSSLRLVFASGEALTQDLVKFFAQKSQAQLHNLYGPTEAAIDVTFYPCQPEASEINVPIGQPIANTQIHILNDQQQPVPIGVAGELYIGGVGLAQGYWQQPELTAERFIQTEWGRLYRSGDRARWEHHGVIRYLGRNDRQVKLNGLRIELGEIEVSLFRHPQVKQVAVTMHNNESSAYLTAYVLGEFANMTTMSQTLTQFLSDRLPNYMVPTQWLLLETFPLTANGKLDWQALPKPGQTPTPSSRPVETATEKMIAEIWGDVLRRDSIGAMENLFEIGGNSLIATRINSRLQEAFQQELPLQNMFNHPTIAQFASYIDRTHSAQKDQPHKLEDWQIATTTVRPKLLPLSFAQQRLWFLDQLQPGTGNYNIPVAVRIQGQLDTDALLAAMTQLIQRQEGLRFQFINQAGEPHIAIRSPESFMLPCVDLSSQSLAEQEQTLKQAMRQEIIQPFDLSQDWLIRGQLLKAAEQDYVLLLTLHHIVTDGWSMDILVQELAALYRSIVLDRPVDMPPLPIQYVDFALWQRQYLQGEILDRQLNYWQTALAEPRPVLQLPTDAARSRIQTFEGAVHQFALSPELSQSLKTLAQQENTTLFVLLLAAYKVVLAKYTGQDDIIVGCPIANRRQAQLENIIGLFVNTLVLRDQVNSTDTFQQFLAQVRQHTYDAYDHQDLPFEYLVEQLQPERDLSYNPLFQVKFRLENAPTASIELPGISLSKLPQIGFSSKLDLSLDMYETETQLVGGFEYNQTLFQAETIARFQQHFVNCLTTIVQNPAQEIATISLLSEQEQRQLLVEWNQTDRPYPENELFIQRFEAQAAQFPEAIALLYQPANLNTAPTTLTYQELNQRSNQLARHLQSLGVTAETLVGICLERSLDMIIALLAVFKAGGAYVPLDANYPEERLRFMLKDAQVKVLLTQSHLSANLPSTNLPSANLPSANLPSANLPTDNTTTIALDQLDYSHYATHNFPCPARINNLAYLIYTSGSTGLPKGVLVEHAGLLNLTLDKIRVCQVEPGDRVLQFFSFSFDASIPEIVMSLGCGATLCLAANEALLPGMGLLQLLRSHAITHITITPSALAQTPYNDLPALKMVLVGGEAPSPELIQQWSQNRLFINAYGPTETTVNASMVPCGNEYPLLPTIRPSTNKQLYILNHSRQPMPIGVIGELYISGVGLARGYHNRPEATAAKFHANPWRPSDRMYQTGDLAYYLPDGRIRLVGRVDDQVKIRGFRIELAEIETLLYQHPTIETAVVIAREAKLFAYVTCKTIAAEDETSQSDISQSDIGSTLRRYLRQKLPEYMVPAAVIVLPQFPLTPNGKIDLKSLPEVAYQTDQTAKPQNTSQEKLLLIYQNILQIETIGINDDFFELGGHSLLATQLVAQVVQTFGVELTVMDLFNAPTVASLSEQILRYQIQGKSSSNQAVTNQAVTNQAVTNQTLAADTATEREEFEL